MKRWAQPIICPALLIFWTLARAPAAQTPAVGFLEFFQQSSNHSVVGRISEPAWDIHLFVPGANREIAAPAADDGVLSVSAGDFYFAGWPGRTDSIRPNAIAARLSNDQSQDRQVMPGLALAMARYPLREKFDPNPVELDSPKLTPDDESAKIAVSADGPVSVAALFAAILLAATGLIWLAVLIKKPALLKEAALSDKSARRLRLADPDRLDVREFL